MYRVSWTALLNSGDTKKIPLMPPSKNEVNCTANMASYPVEIRKNKFEWGLFKKKFRHINKTLAVIGNTISIDATEKIKSAVSDKTLANQWWPQTLKLRKTINKTRVLKYTKTVIIFKAEPL